MSFNSIVNDEFVMSTTKKRREDLEIVLSSCLGIPKTKVKKILAIIAITLRLWLKDENIIYFRPLGTFFPSGLRDDGGDGDSGDDNDNVDTIDENNGTTTLRTSKCKTFIPLTTEGLDDPNNVVRESIISYYQLGYPARLSWTHPITGDSYDADGMEAALSFVAKCSEQHYDVIKQRWFGRTQYEALADALFLSVSTLRRRETAAITTILLFLLDHSVTVEDFSDII